MDHRTRMFDEFYVSKLDSSENEDFQHVFDDAFEFCRTNSNLVVKLFVLYFDKWEKAVPGAEIPWRYFGQYGIYYCHFSKYVGSVATNRIIRAASILLESHIYWGDFVTQMHGRGLLELDPVHTKRAHATVTNCLIGSVCIFLVSLSMMLMFMSFTIQYPLTLLKVAPLLTLFVFGIVQVCLYKKIQAQFLSLTVIKKE